MAWMVNHSLRAQNHAIFSGGITDGSTMSCFIPPSGNLIFAGGSADGYTQNSFLHSSNNSLFAGGSADGYTQNGFLQPRNNSLFAGGIADGYGQNIGTIGNPNNDCSQNTIFVTNALLTSSLDSDFKAIEFIHSDGVLNTRPSFLFRAGTAVTLNPEFTVPAGIIFSVEIGPCPD